MARGTAGRPQLSVKTGEKYALAEWFNKNVDFMTELTNEELAEKLGYTRPNIISMWRTGRTRIPLDRLSLIAEILNVDLAFLLPLWVEQYGGGELYAKTLKVMANVVSDSEMKLIQAVRKTTKGQDFKLKPNAAKTVADIIQL